MKFAVTHDVESSFSGEIRVSRCTVIVEGPTYIDVREQCRSRGWKLVRIETVEDKFTAELIVPAIAKTATELAREHSDSREAQGWSRGYCDGFAFAYLAVQGCKSRKAALAKLESEWSRIDGKAHCTIAKLSGRSP